MFEPYYGRPVVVYQDPYSSWFWYWLLDQSLEQRALWAYHHRATMAEARYRELLARDAQLEARIRELERQDVSRDPTYRPGDIDPDLMYSDAYVDAVYNPQPKVAQRAAEASPRGGFGTAARTLLIIVAVLGVLCLGIWLVFFKRWGGT
jgi:hypothetical protein